MLGEYKVSRFTRQCHALQRPLREGEWYYSVVTESGDGYLRRDYSAESWSGAPEGAVGWWKSRMPTAGEKKMVLAPPGVLVDLLRQMEHFPAKAKSRYLLALTLMRRRIVRPLDDRRTDGTLSEEQGKADRNMLRLQVIVAQGHDGEIIDVAVCPITRSEAELLRQELVELLYCEAEPQTEPDTEA
jgi:hypothetical protein